MVIVHPMRPRIIAGIVLAVIFVIWLTSAAIALPSLIYADTLTIEYCHDTRVVCYLHWPDGNYGIIDFWYVHFGISHSRADSILIWRRIHCNYIAVI